MFWFFITFGVVNRGKIVKIWKLKITKDYYFGEMENYFKCVFFLRDSLLLFCNLKEHFYVCSDIFGPHGLNFYFKSALESCWHQLSNATLIKLKSFHGNRRYLIKRLRSRKICNFRLKSWVFRLLLLSYVSVVLLMEMQIAII